MVSEARAQTVLVVGVDLTPLSEHLLRTTRALVGPGDHAEIHLVHVIAPPHVPTTVLDAIPMGPSSRVQVAEAEEHLERMARELAAVTSASVQCLISIGDPADELASVARNVDADVIVVEAHGRRGLRRMFHRSTAARLSRDAPCSVLTVRPRGDRLSLAPEPPEITASSAQALR